MLTLPSAELHNLMQCGGLKLPLPVASLPPHRSHCSPAPLILAPQPLGSWQTALLCSAAVQGSDQPLMGSVRLQLYHYHWRARQAAANMLRNGRDPGGAAAYRSWAKLPAGSRHRWKYPSSLHAAIRSIAKVPPEVNATHSAQTSFLDDRLVA